MHHLSGFTHVFGKSQSQVAGAASNVKHPVTFVQVGNHHGISLPSTVQPHRHQVVHDIVLGRNRIKNTAHVAGFVGFINRLKSKMGGSHGCILFQWLAQPSPALVGIGSSRWAPATLRRSS